jgi:hypothetical protein
MAQRVRVRMVGAAGRSAGAGAGVRLQGVGTLEWRQVEASGVVVNELYSRCFECTFPDRNRRIGSGADCFHLGLHESRGLASSR